MATRGWPAAVIHGAHLFVISSQHGDSWKQRTGYGDAEQKAIRSTTVQPPRPRCSLGGCLWRPRGQRARGCPVVATRSHARAGVERRKTERAGAKCWELPVRKRTFRRHFYFVSAENSRLTRRERRCRFSKEREKDRCSRFRDRNRSERSVSKSERLLFRNVSHNIACREPTENSHMTDANNVRFCNFLQEVKCMT